MTTAIVLLVVAVSVEGAGLIALGVLWLRARRRHQLAREQLAALREPSERPPRRLVPTGREVVKGVWETAALVREKGLGGAIRSSIDELAGWAQVERPDLVRLAGPDGGMSILFSDIEGSTALNEQLGDRQWVRLLARHDRAVRARVEKHGGHVVKTQGDGFMVAFPDPERAVRCAVSVQRAFDRGLKAGKPQVLVRIGIHHGDVVHRENDIFGRNVAQAARVAAHAEGGEILVSEAVVEALDAHDDLVLREPREVELKGLRGQHLVTPVFWGDRDPAEAQG
ncbi:adenylate/guanylate cyclase domain-containing protein [Nocardioides dongkuii]|uniref:adenylate/guanylate cyclase domain-containing protein n=1 Tax=Nocardioides dongkuii TaxID=2760089 RepID=UPI001C70A8B6|nr:adenylate/guanylate cyclase domain-containing protein [Nocardioides dongkuii]